MDGVVVTIPASVIVNRTYKIALGDGPFALVSGLVRDLKVGMRVLYTPSLEEGGKVLGTITAEHGNKGVMPTFTVEWDSGLTLEMPPHKLTPAHEQHALFAKSVIKPGMKVVYSDEYLDKLPKWRSDVVNKDYVGVVKSVTPGKHSGYYSVTVEWPAGMSALSSEHLRPYEQRSLFADVNAIRPGMKVKYKPEFLEQVTTRAGMTKHQEFLRGVVMTVKDLKTVVDGPSTTTYAKVEWPDGTPAEVEVGALEPLRLQHSLFAAQSLTLYHVTTLAIAEKIKAEGFKPVDQGVWKNYYAPQGRDGIYFYDDLKYSEAYAAYAEGALYTAKAKPGAPWSENKKYWQPQMAIIKVQVPENIVQITGDKEDGFFVPTADLNQVKILGIYKYDYKPTQGRELGERVAASVAKTAISLPELVQQTNAFSTKHRPGCVPTLTKSNPKELFLQYQVTCHNEDYNDPNGHEVRVKFDVEKIKENQRANDLDIQVSCSCPAFLYWGAQWNLHQRDGLLGPARPLLQAPTERLDLRSNFVICKHCKAVFERILPAIQHNINNIIRSRKVEENKRRKEEEEKKKLETPTPEDIEQLEQEAEEIAEQEGVVEREVPATPGEREKHPEGVEAPRYKKWIDKLKERVKGWHPEAPVHAPTPEHKPPKPEAAEKSLREPAPAEEHPETPHLDTGLPYVPRWKKTIEKLKNRIKSWGKKSHVAAKEPGLLFRAGNEAEKSHDYHPEQDADSYPINKRPPPKLAKAATEACKRIYTDLKRKGIIDKWMFGFEVWACDLRDWGAVATYINGTYDFPVILIDLRQHIGYEDQIGKSIWHELKHAEQESRGDEFDESEAEED